MCSWGLRRTANGRCSPPFGTASQENALMEKSSWHDKSNQQQSFVSSGTQVFKIDSLKLWTLSLASWLHPVHMVTSLESWASFFVILENVVFRQLIIQSIWQLCKFQCKVEMNDFCASVLRGRQKDGCLPMCGISSDVTKYHPDADQRRAALVAAGFPCQAVSAWVCCVDVHELIFRKICWFGHVRFYLCCFTWCRVCQPLGCKRG